MAPRPATPDDAAAIGRVHVTGWQGAYAHVFPPERLAELSAEGRGRWWSGQLTDPPERTAVIVDEDRGEPVGFVSVGPSRDADTDPLRVGELYAIYVLPERWGSGFGRRLMERGSRGMRAAELRGGHPLGARRQPARAAVLRGGRLGARRRLEN
jgi:GNAT superfamily N-acetyltransferase